MTGTIARKTSLSTLDKMRISGRLWMLIPVSIAVIAAAVFLMSLLVPPTIVVTMTGDAMLPTIHDGQGVTVLEGHYESNPIERGDVVTIELKTMEESLVRRVIALAGDTLDFPGGRVSVNGAVLQEDYVNDPGRLLSEDELNIVMIPLDRYGSVPSGTVFVLNDNRDVGGDSRDIGFIASSYVTGKVLV